MVFAGQWLRFELKFLRELLVVLSWAFLLTAILLSLPYGLGAAEPDLKPGDRIGPHNWQRVQGLVGENLLRRIKQGYTLVIKQSRSVGPPREYGLATARYASQVRLATNGELINYVAGLPFPDLDFSDPQVGLKLAWNFYWRWIGDDSKTGGGTGEGKIIRYAIEKDGSERRADVLHHTINNARPSYTDSKPVLPDMTHR